MAQIATLLSIEQRRRFGSLLLGRAEWLISAAESKPARRAIQDSICEALSQPSRSRLRSYSKGTLFPTPKVVTKLASALDMDLIVALMQAGYQREVLRALQRLYLASRKHGKRADDLRRAAIAYAVLVFPRRGERYRPGSEPWEGIRLVQRAITAVAYTVSVEEGSQRIIVRALRTAYECLGERSIAITVERRRIIAGELVRSWAYDFDAKLAGAAETSTYLRTSDEFESLPGLPQLLPNLMPTSIIARGGT
jgi:hypothetical protein